MQLTKRRKNSIFTFVIRLGGVAQLVERLNGIQEVRGSTPLISTTDEKNEPDFIGFFFFFGDSARQCRAACGVNPLRAGAAFMRYFGDPAGYCVPVGKRSTQAKE